MERSRRHRVRLLVTVALCAWLAGCISENQIRSDISRHRAVRYKLWRSEREGEASERQLLAGPLSLEDGILIALANSRRIRTALLEREKADAQILGAYAEALPTFEVGADYTRLDETPGFGGVRAGYRDNYSLTNTVRQPLYKGGLIAAGVRAARLFSMLVDEQRRGAYQAVIYDVRKTYYDALLAAELERSSAEALSVARRRLEDVRKDRAAGSASDFDVLRAEVEVKNLLAENVRDQNRFRLAISSLLNLMGVSQESRVELTYSLTYEPVQPTIEEAVRTACEQHPSLFQGELAVRVQEQAAAAARAGYLPEVELTFTDTFSKPDPHNTALNRWDDAWSVGVGVTLKVFEGFSTVAKVRKEKAALKQRKVALRDTEEVVLLAIRHALLSLTDAARLVESQEANVAQAGEALRLSELGFRQGVLKEIDFLDARRSLSRARANYAQAVYSYELARLDFERATGALAPPDTPPGGEGISSKQ